MMATEKDLIRAYEAATKAFKKAESVLDGAVKGLLAARDSEDRASITPARKRAQEAEIAAKTAWEAMERARQDYWDLKARQAKGRFLEEAAGLLGVFEECTRRAMPLVPPGHQSQILLGMLAVQPRPPYAGPAEVPTAPLESAVLDLADDEVF